MQRTLASELNKLVDQNVTIAGWVKSRRNHGKVVFLDIRDRSGLAQAVCLPGTPGQVETADISPESVVKIEGKVTKRPADMVNPKIISGEVEIQAAKIEILAKADLLPFELDDTKSVNEETRLKYRYLDLRSPRMAANLLARHRTNQFVRNWLTQKGFVEVETPFLTKSTPEGARDFLVPSRIQKGKFYALPQSPQQYKQLLQVAGLERYFQLARNFRDEDQRGDRQPEFTQIDIEASFIDQEDIIQLSEELLINLVGELYPQKHFTVKPFPRLSYREAMERYQSDRPDLRKNSADPDELAVCWVVDFPMFERKQDGSIGATHHPFTALQDQIVDNFEKEELENIVAKQYDLVVNGNEVAGGSIRTYRADVLERIFKYLGHNSLEIKQKFGHLLDAFCFGVPPHGGIAWGYDRLLMILQNENNIREIIPFPKTGDGRDPLMDSPSEVDAVQLKELGLKLDPKKS